MVSASAIDCVFARVGDMGMSREPSGGGDAGATIGPEGGVFAPLFVPLAVPDGAAPDDAAGVIAPFCCGTIVIFAFSFFGVDGAASVDSLIVGDSPGDVVMIPAESAEIAGEPWREGLAAIELGAPTAEPFGSVPLVACVCGCFELSR
jgi:hypothetical protein